MTDATPDQITGGAADTDRLARLRAGLKRRHARETRFKWYGRLAIGAAMVFLAILLIRIVEQGHTAFYTHTVTIPVYMDPARIDRAYPQGSNFEQLAAEQELAPQELSGQVRLGTEILLRLVQAAPAALATNGVVLSRSCTESRDR